MSPGKRALRRLLAPVLAASLLVAPAASTWSVVAVDTRTGEVAVASATCLPNANLKLFLPVVRAGHGVAAAQSVVDTSGFTRQIIWDGFLAGLTPEEILQQLAQLDPQHVSRQYGIVDLFADPATFTGAGAGIAKAGVVGIAGDLRYAIQGNVLTGDVVVLAAEAALLETQGDLSQKVMAAMEAARGMGGDGRCSCSIGAPTGCGAPPPYFRKSAHTAFIVLARIGDRDGTCDGQKGCANGEYYLDLSNKGGVKKPDPVIQLARLYADWRLQLVGVPDQVKSEVWPSAAALSLGGASSLEVHVALADLEGGPVAPEGLVLSAERLDDDGPSSHAGAFVDLGGGNYVVPFQASSLPGQDVWRLWVEDAAGRRIALQPDVTLDVAGATAPGR